MSLAVVLRVSAGWMGLWVIMMFFAPEMVVEGAGWEVGVEVRTILQGMGMAYIGLIVTQLVTATLVEEAMKKLAFWMAIMWAVNNIQQVYFMANGTFAMDGKGIFGVVVGFAFAGMLYIKSKSDA